MRRVRLAIAGLLVALAATALSLVIVAAGGASRARPFHYTHTIMVSGELVDKWAVDDSSACGPVGKGSVTVKFHLAKPQRVRPYIDPTHNGEPNNTLGSWVVAVPAGGGAGDMPYRPAVGTITRVDHREPRTSPAGPCEPFDKSQCRTVPLVRAIAVAQGYNRRSISADLSHVQWDQDGARPNSCHVGLNTLFTDGRLTGGTPLRGELLLRMPPASVLDRRRVVTVTATTHKRTVLANCGGGGSCSDDVTRRVTVTFTRLRHG